MENPKVDFFVSYTNADRAWAEWIAWQLELSGHTTTIQAWDFRAGQNFALAMQDASVCSERTIAVISPAFFESYYTRAEWAAAFSEDPDGKEGKFVPVRVRDCKPPGLHKANIYIDLVGLEETEASRTLLSGVRMQRTVPQDSPDFPGAQAVDLSDAPAFPGDTPPIWNVPVATLTFEGRGQPLARLARELSDDGRAAVTQTQAVHGLGGVGKTQLVARFAHDHRAEYDIVWWIRAEQDATRLADYAALGTKLALPEAVDPDQSSLVLATKTWLERSRRWLLIFDNAPHPEALSPLLPTGHAGHVLITSRRHADWRALGATPVQLDVWERHESVDFLLRSTGSEDQQAADEVAEMLGDLPLALAQAAAYTNEQAIELNTYHDRLTERAGDLLAEGKPLTYEHTVATTWDLAFEQIRGNRFATRVLAICAYLAPERVPRELLVDADLLEVPTAGNSESIADEAIRTLLNYALLTPADHETLNVHRLVQQVARARLDVNTQRASAEAAVEVVRVAFPSKIWEPEYWPVCTRLISHALTATSHAQVLDVASEGVSHLLGKITLFLQVRGDYTQAKTIGERALKATEHAYGPDHPEVARALGNFGLVLDRLANRQAARSGLERSLEIMEEAYGPDHPEVAKALTNFGIALERLDDLPAARSVQERALKIKEEAYGPDHPQLATTLTNLGNVLLRLGDFPGARSTLERALQIKEEAYGPDHPEVATTLTNLGNALGRPEDLPVARSTLERSLKIKEEAYGPDHPELAITLFNLGVIFLRLDDLPAGRANMERALAIFERSLGLRHPHTHQARAMLEDLEN